MTEHSDAVETASMRYLLDDTAQAFFPGSAPYGAIVGAARRRIRVRAVGGSVLGLAAIGAAVAIGAGGFGGADHAPVQSAAAGGVESVPAPVAATTAAAPANNDHYGKTVIAQGDFEGTHWTLARDVTLKENTAVPSGVGTDAKPAKGPWVFDDVYFTGPNGLRDRAAGGGSTAPGHIAEILDRFSRPNADVIASATLTTLGTGALDDSSNKEKPSPYGIDFLSGIVSSKVARVQIVFQDGTSQDAKLVAAPDGEDGQYFYLPFKSPSRDVHGHIALYDGQGQVLHPHLSQLSQF